MNYQYVPAGPEWFATDGVECEPIIAWAMDGEHVPTPVGVWCGDLDMLTWVSHRHDAFGECRVDQVPAWIRARLS